jgi:hypothetical protein
VLIQRSRDVKALQSTFLSSGGSGPTTASPAATMGSCGNYNVISTLQLTYQITPRSCRLHPPDYNSTRGDAGTKKQPRSSVHRRRARRRINAAQKQLYQLRRDLYRHHPDILGRRSARRNDTPRGEKQWSGRGQPFVARDRRGHMLVDLTDSQKEKVHKKVVESRRKCYSIPPLISFRSLRMETGLPLPSCSLISLFASPSKPEFLLDCRRSTENFHKGSHGEIGEIEGNPELSM